MIRIGFDVGSTTLKCVVLDEDNNILYKNYQRHYSEIPQKVSDMLEEISKEITDENATVSISGSAGMGFSESMEIPFVQEVYATRLAVKKLLPKTDVVIELGGEDAKILFISGMPEVRMNGSCAGGTGAFIDQMATLLNIDPITMNEYAKDSNKIYSIASRCGVFAKSDIQPLLNQGARKEDIAASIFYCVVNQTIAGLSQGREIKGEVVYLGGPLSFFSELRKSFDTTLKHEGVCPENSLYYVAYGTALSGESTGEEKKFNLIKLREKIINFKSDNDYMNCEALFENEAQYAEFAKRHKINEPVKLAELGENGNAYIGVDAGSTTLKAVVLNENEEIVHFKYMQNGGTPVPLVKDFLVDVYEKFPNINIKSFATTGYGEEIIKNAFHGDIGVVETMAHFTGAKKFQPKVDFIIDIGGQDIKCFKIRNGSIDNIFLNEACSSGCGSFLQTFAEALGKNIEEFSKIGLFAEKPVDLGSRCTVFMNSSVKQAQKDGASIESISSGLSISVVKNAIYKVIRASGPDSLGKNIVVQGGTFLNEAVLRAFEKEIGRNVVRPSIAGLMGAFGAALYGKHNFKGEKSTVLCRENLESFTHTVKATTCKGCSNNCKLTINIFDEGRRFIGGNRCEKPVTSTKKKHYNLFEYKLELLSKYKNFAGKRETVGIPMGLNNFELLPFWHTFFKSLGFGITKSELSTRDIYLKGQNTIPSDTVCYPAKIIHGHIKELVEKKVDAIFYPCMSYAIDEKRGDNNYNCPVVAYYPEVIGSNMNELDNVKYIHDYIGLHRKKDFEKKITKILSDNFGAISLKEIKKASDLAYAEYENFTAKIREKGEKYLNFAKKNNMPIIVLAGRPYHIDPEINHGIDSLICDFDAVLLSEDSICHLADKVSTAVLNQWTFHSRMYSAAKYVTDCDYKNINLIQLVSFGCGVDAITTDEVRLILEKKNKIYTQIKIDEITNLGAIKIRVRSLFAAT